MIETSDVNAVPKADVDAPIAKGALGDRAPKTMEQVRAERYEKAAAGGAAPAAADPAASAKAAEDAKAAEAAKAAAAAKPPEGTTATIDMDESALRQATALSRETREAKAKAKELEAKVKEAEPVLAAAALAKQGKHLEAIKALGIDLNAAVAETLADPAAAAEPTPEQKELARINAELEAQKARDKERDERDAKLEGQRLEAAKAADVKAVGEFVKKEAAKYPFLSRSDAWVADAYEGAVDAHATLVKKHGRELTDQERHNLVLAALDEAEAGHVANAKLYGATQNPSNVKIEDPPPSMPSARPATFSGDLRGGTSTPVVKAKSRMTFSEAKRARREASNG